MCFSRAEPRSEKRRQCILYTTLQHWTRGRSMALRSDERRSSNILPTQFVLAPFLSFFCRFKVFYLVLQCWYGYCRVGDASYMFLKSLIMMDDGVCPTSFTLIKCLDENYLSLFNILIKWRNFLYYYSLHSSLSVHVFAQDVTIDGLGYSLLSDGTAYVSTFQDATLTGAITIPSSITSDTTTYQVIALGNNCFDSCTKITSVKLPVGIKYLGDRCFYGCSALESCNISNTVIEIGNGCSEHCWNLKSVDIQGSPANLIGTFAGCYRLESVNLQSSATDMSTAFYGCTSLVSVNIPSTVTNLSSTFSGCTSLESVNIPSTVTSLLFTFNGCSSLKSLDIPSSVKYIDHAFRGV